MKQLVIMVVFAVIGVFIFSYLFKKSTNVVKSVKKTLAKLGESEKGEDTSIQIYKKEGEFKHVCMIDGEAVNESLLDLEFRIKFSDWSARLEYSRDDTILSFTPEGKLFDVTIATKKLALVDRNRVIKTCYDEFDSLFHVMGDEERKIKKMLDAEVRGALIFLANMSKNSVELSLPSVDLNIRLSTWITDEEPLERMLKRARTVCIGYERVSKQYG